jgi:hypothetical protein
MTVRDVTKLLALKLRLSNPQDFTLVALVDGQGALQTISFQLLGFSTRL